MKRNLTLLVLVMAGSGLASGLLHAEDGGKKRARLTDPGRPQLVLHYDFFGVDGDRVPDASGHKHDGKLVGGEIVFGRRRPAISFDGEGSITVADRLESFGFTSHTLSIGARCKSTSADGVIISVGDDTNGLSLYLQRGIPHFAVRCAGKLVTVAGTEPVGTDRWVHLFGALDARGNVVLVVNGWPVAQAKGSTLAEPPTEPLCVGADVGVPVGDYVGPLPWHGLIESVRIYWGVIDRNADREELGDWADLPGCGCNR